MYQHLPAGGLGTRDPVRPYPTGGLGFAYRIFRAVSDLTMKYSSFTRRIEITSTVEGEDGFTPVEPT